MATGHDPDTGRYVGLTLPGAHATFGMITDHTLLIDPQWALEQAAAEPGGTGVRGGDTQPGTSRAHGGSQPAGVEALPSSSGPTVFHASMRLDPERYARDFARIAQEIIARLGEARVHIDVEIHASNTDGFASDVIRTITENSHTLKLDTYGFED